MEKDKKSVCQGQKIIVVSDENELARRGADFFVQTIAEYQDARDRFSVALSGGTTPRPMYRCLSRPPYVSAIPWETVHLFWVDERMVPFDDPDSNYGAAKDDFLSRIPIPTHHLHPMPVRIPPDRGALQYESELKAFFADADEDPLFDLIYLGMGNDGHTASLFPGQEAVRESSAWVLHVKGGNPRLPRLTLTPRVLNRAKRIIFMISGRGKAPILKTLWENGEKLLPVKEIRPPKGEVIWLVDRAAASLLPEEAKTGGFCANGTPHNSKK